MSEIYKPVNGTTQIPAALASDGSLKVNDSGLNWKPSIIATNGNGYPTTSAYLSAIAGPVVIARPYSSIAVHVKESNTNAVTYKILGYLETSGFTKPITLLDATAVAKNSEDNQVITQCILAIDVVAIDTVAETHGLLKVDVAAS